MGGGKYCSKKNYRKKILWQKKIMRGGKLLLQKKYRKKNYDKKKLRQKKVMRKKNEKKRL